MCIQVSSGTTASTFHYAESRVARRANHKHRAPCGNRTHYLFLTKEVLYQ